MPIFRVLYRRFPTFRDSDPPLTQEDLPTTHIFVCEVEAEHLDDLYRQMQAERWSPHGEARPLIARLGLGHTSMSIGDVAQDEAGRSYECLFWGWREILPATRHPVSAPVGPASPR